MNPPITALILAGGMGRRMGGEDKGLVEFSGRPLIEHILAAIEPQVTSIIINANRNQARYEAYGHPVVADELANFQGPLAGFLAGMKHSPSDDFVTLPCDGPFVTADLVERLLAARQSSQADLAVAHDGTRMQPVYCLLNRSLEPSLQAFIDNGDRKIDLWFDQHPTALADFSDSPNTFANLNRPDDRAQLEALFNTPRTAEASA